MANLNHSVRKMNLKEFEKKFTYNSYKKRNKFDTLILFLRVVINLYLLSSFLSVATDPKSSSKVSESFCMFTIYLRINCVYIVTDLTIQSNQKANLLKLHQNLNYSDLCNWTRQERLWPLLTNQPWVPSPKCRVAWW